MNDYWQLVLAAMAGLGLGLVFYGGLYLTVTRGLYSQRPTLWFTGSFLLRMGLVLTGFHFVSDGHWQRLIACLAAFVVTGAVFQSWNKMPRRLHQAPTQPLPATYHKTNTKPCASDKTHHAS
jgi:F1F0 ATPase subunit 2